MPYLAKKYADYHLEIDGIDSSKERLRFAKKNSDHSDYQNIKFSLCDLSLEEGLPQKSYDIIICRYVLHHLEKPQNVLIYLYRMLKPWRVSYFLVDLDGIMVNFHSTNHWLNDQLKMLSTKMWNRCHFARQIPSLLIRGGVNPELIQQSAEMMNMDTQGRIEEALQYLERLRHAKDFMSHYFKSKEDQQKFIDLYVDEFQKTYNPQFVIKFFYSV